MNQYVPLSEASNSLDKHQIFFYFNDKGEKVGGLNQQKVQASAGDRNLHVSFHDVFHGHLLGAEHNCPAKKLKEGAEPMSYKELLESLDKRGHNMPTVYHFGTRGGDNGASPIYQRGSFNKDKVEAMAQGRPISQTPLHLYKGALMGTEYNK